MTLDEKRALLSEFILALETEDCEVIECWPEEPKLEIVERFLARTSRVGWNDAKDNASNDLSSEPTDG